MSELRVEIREGVSLPQPMFGGAGGVVMVTPPLDEDFWVVRVPVSDKQAVVAFPKFGTIGIGFQHEEDWNTNLPYRCPTEQIAKHIMHNKGDDSVPEQRVHEAIALVQEAVRLLRGEPVSEQRTSES